MSVDKNVKCTTLKNWLKLVKDTDHLWIIYDRLESVKTKRIQIEGSEIEIRTNYIYPINTDMSFRDKTYTDPKPIAISLSWSDKDNFYNFIKASNPDNLSLEIWAHNDSDWLKKRNLSYETVIVDSRVKSKKYKDYYEYNGYKFKADKIYDPTEHNHTIINWIKTENDLQYYPPINTIEFKETK